MLIFHAGPFLEGLSAFICVSLRRHRSFQRHARITASFPEAQEEEVGAPRPPEAGGRNLQEMDSPPRRRRRHSRDQPFDLSGLVNKLQLDSDSFTSLLNSNEPRMREIVEELLRISEEVKDMQRRKDSQRRVGAGGGGGSSLFSVFAAAVADGAAHRGVKVTKVMSESGSAEKAAHAGEASVVGVKVTKVMSVEERGQKAKNLGEEFMEIVEPMKKLLVHIHQICKDLEENVSKYQAKESLKDVEDLQKFIHQVSELKKKSGGVIFGEEVFFQYVTEWLTKLVVSIWSLFGSTETPEEDQKLRDTIIQSADQSQKITENFCLMREELAKFRK